MECSVKTDRRERDMPQRLAGVIIEKAWSESGNFCLNSVENMLLLN